MIAFSNLRFTTFAPSDIRPERLSSYNTSPSFFHLLFWKSLMCWPLKL